MSEAPGTPWRVRVFDLSGGAEDGVVEEIGPFGSADEAAAFARCYVRDSIERCRAPGLDAEAVLDAWRTFGEDASVLEGDVARRTDEADLRRFAARRASRAERDWRALDPRRGGEEDE